jgi:phage terminase large subunit-like protein
VRDEFEPGPDPNEIRRHAKKMLTEREYRDTYCKILRYKPHPKQLEAHNSQAHRVCILAGNQQGKTHCIGAQMTIDALGSYDDFNWYKGPRVLDKDCLLWAAGPTTVMARDGVMTKLLGDLNRPDGMGQGLIPLDAIVGRPVMATGAIRNYVDTATIRRATGGIATLRFKAFAQGDQVFQSEAVHRLWLDEDPGHGAVVADLFGECLARTTTTRGRIYFSATASRGETPIIKYFLEQRARGDCAMVTMGLADALHIPKFRHAEIMGQYQPWELDCRVHGAIMRGEGRVFSTPEDQIAFTRDLRANPFPEHWPWLAAVDFSHAGGSEKAHPFAYVLACWSRDDGNVIYIVRAMRIRGGLPLNHVAAIKAHPMWDARVCWPHDGHVRDLVGGETFAGIYKRLGLNMEPSHATFPDGTFDFEGSLTEMAQRLDNGMLKVLASEQDWFQEYRNLHRDGGLVVKIDDDLLSATRILCMAIRRAKVLESDRPGQPDFYRGRFRSGSEQNVARNVNFDLFSGGSLHDDEF